MCLRPRANKKIRLGFLEQKEYRGENYCRKGKWPEVVFTIEGELLFQYIHHNSSGQEGKVGAFEGGNYMAEGIYRSQQNCIMFTRTTDFCAVCSEAIEKVIDEYTLAD